MRQRESAGPPGGALTLLNGRFDDEDADGPRFAWSGSSIAACFSSSAITVRLRGTGNFFGISIDGVPRPAVELTAAGEQPLRCDGLGEGAHTIALYKRTEPLVGEAQLLGLELGPGGQWLPPPAPPPRRIEFVGDSITAGYGNLALDASVPFSPASEDYALSFAGLTAHRLAAESVAVAWSGRGLCRNYADEPGDPMPVLWERTLPARPDSRWDFTRWQPHVVVINLGTNDFSVGRAPPDALFAGAYSELLQRLHAVYPSALLLCGLGPMLGSAELAAARPLVAAAIERAGRRGAAAAELVEFPAKSAADGYGSDWHPSLTTHRRMADQLTGLIRARLGW